jgi:very-short-patch-repair endonuclease
VHRAQRAAFLSIMSRASRLASLRLPSSSMQAKELRSNMSDAESRLWYYLRAKRFRGLKFRRQAPMGRYVVDFLCEEAHLVLEVDGGQHAERVEEDSARTHWLNARGYRVIRFWNSDVWENVDGVLDTLAAALTLSPTLSQGRGSKP